MDKKKEMNFNLNNFLLATSTVFDIFYEDLYKTNRNFLKKNAYLSIKIGQALGFEDSKLADLCSVALSYNLGLYHNRQSYINKEECFKLLEKFPFNSKEYLDELLTIVLLVDKILEKYNLDDSSLKNKKKIIEYLESLENEDETNKEILLAYLEDYVLWCDIKNENDIVYFIYSSLADFTKVMKFEELLTFTEKFNELINDNSSIVKYASEICDYYEFEHKDKYVFMIASTLKDIGKIAIKKEIYYKNSSLSEDERESIKEYPYYTKKVLNNIQGLKDIASLAYKIQEKLNADGYTFGLDSKDISFKDRLLQVASVYDSLKNDKPFRKAYNTEETFNILEELGDEEYLDKSIIPQLKTVLK